MRAVVVGSARILMMRGLNFNYSTRSFSCTAKNYTPGFLRCSLEGVKIPMHNVSPSFKWLLPTTIRRNLAQNTSSSGGGGGKDGEQKIKIVLQKAFPTASKLLVEDISGGCGSMYQVLVEDNRFTNLSIVKQHQLVNLALKEEIKDMHGIRIQTQSPKH